MKKSLIFCIAICIFSVTFSFPNLVVTRSLTRSAKHLTDAVRDADVSGVPMFNSSNVRDSVFATLLACTTVSSLGHVQNYHVPGPLFVRLHILCDRLREKPTLESVSETVRGVLQNSAAFLNERIL